MLSIIVCVKQVPVGSGVNIDRNTGVLLREASARDMNPDDYHAIEMALSLRDRYGGTICALSMGPPSAEDVLREAFAFGADKACLVSDPCFAGSDSYVTAVILGRAISLLGGCDILLTGVEAIDGGTASVSCQLSEKLGLPHFTGIHKIDINEKHAVIERLYGHEYQKVKSALPVILAINKESNRVRHPSVSGISRCCEKKIIRFGIKEIGGEKSEYGLPGSPTRVYYSEKITHSRGRQKIEGLCSAKAAAFLDIMKQRNLLKY